MTERKRREALAFAALLGVSLPAAAGAQHFHGSDLTPARRRPVPRASTPGLLPLGSPRPIEVLVLDYGFSPKEIGADVGETVTLQVRLVDPVCPGGLAVPERRLALDLPLGETVSVTMELKSAESIELRCVGGNRSANILVRPR